MFGKDTLDDFTTEVFNAWSLYSRVHKTDMTSREKLMQLLKLEDRKRYAPKACWGPASHAAAQHGYREGCFSLQYHQIDASPSHE